jgi:origin recognition complex subunit 3
VLLFGIATSVSLFHERLPRAATRCLSGLNFSVENTDVILDRIIKKTIANAMTPVKLGSALVEELVARQRDHLQSVQAFSMSLKVGRQLVITFAADRIVRIYVPFLWQRSKHPD